MSTIEVTREFWKLWNEKSIGELVSRYDDFFTVDLEWRSPIAEATGARYVGREGLERHIADLLETFDEINAEPVEIVEIAPDVVLSRVDIHGRGSNSGAVVDAPLIAIARMRDCRICWAWGSFDVDAGERLADAMARGEEADALLPDRGKEASRPGSTRA